MENENKKKTQVDILTLFKILLKSPLTIDDSCFEGLSPNDAKWLCNRFNETRKAIEVRPEAGEIFNKVSKSRDEELERELYKFVSDDFYSPDTIKLHTLEQEGELTTEKSDGFFSQTTKAQLDYLFNWFFNKYILDEEYWKYVKSNMDQKEKIKED